MVVFFEKELAREFDFRRKQAGQLASKMRFLSAPWVGLLGDGGWLRNAQHSNAMAALLARKLRDALGVVPGCGHRMMSSIPAAGAGSAASARFMATMVATAASILLLARDLRGKMFSLRSSCTSTLLIIQM